MRQRRDGGKSARRGGNPTVEDLHLMAALYLALIGFAVAGFLGWSRSLRGAPVA